MVAKKTNLSSNSSSYLLRTHSPVYLLTAIILSLALAGFTISMPDHNLRRKLERCLSHFYTASLADRHIVLTDIKILKLSIRTEKTDSAFSSRIINEKIGFIKSDIENRLTQLNSYSTIIRQGRLLSSELFNEALKKSETGTNELEPMIGSFTGLTTQFDNLTRLLNSHQLDSVQATGYVVLFKLEARASQHTAILLDSIHATFNLKNKIERMQDLDLDGMDGKPILRKK